MSSTTVYNTQALYFTEQLKARLADIPGFALTVLEAPLGYGKTTAVRFVLHKANFQVLWYTVYADGVAYFWRGFCRALAPLNPDLADNLRKIGLPADVVLVQKAVELICGVRLTQETVLVIDDYHFVNSPKVDKFFSFLLANLPGKLHVVVMSRTAFLREDVAGLRLKGAVNYIGAADLLLRPGDIANYYALCGITLTADEEARLFTYSEGWITPLYLVMKEYVASGRFLATGSVAALMRSAVYQPLRAELKDFLNYLCLFDSFTVAQAQYMWPPGNAAGLIDELLGKNTFIVQDAVTGQYSFHNLFIAHARDAFARQSAEAQNALWERAGGWYRQTGDCVRAMACFEKAGNFNLLLMVLAEEKGAAVTGEHREKIIEYFDRCPRELKAQNLAATLVFIRLMISYNENARRREACDIFERHIDRFAGPREQKRFLLMEYERLLSLTQYNRIREMAAHHRKAFSYMDSPVTGEESKGNWTFGSPSVLLMFYRESGRLAAHVRDMKECLPDYCRLTDGHGSGAQYVMAAEAALNAGDSETAESVIHKGLYYARAKGQWSILLAAGFVQMRLALMGGDYAEVVAVKRRMADIVETKKQYLLLHTLDMCESYLYLLLGMPDRTADWIAGGDYVNTRLLFPALPALYIVYGRHLLLSGQYRTLSGLADVFFETAAVYPNLLGRIYTLIYLAAAGHKLAANDEAAARLKEALDIAVADQIYLPFAENGGYIIDLLRKFAGEELYGGHIHQIFALRKKIEQGIKTIRRTHFAAPAPALTARENDVATLAAAGLSNRQIAETLMISENTVKARLKTTFDKLAVKSRTQLPERLKKAGRRVPAGY